MVLVCFFLKDFFASDLPVVLFLLWSDSPVYLFSYCLLAVFSNFSWWLSRTYIVDVFNAKILLFVANVCFGIFHHSKVKRTVFTHLLSGSHIRIFLNSSPGQVCRKIYLQIRWFFYFFNSGSLCLQKFFCSLLKCSSKGKQKKERSGRFLELFKEFATEQNLPWLLQKWEHFNLQWRQWMHFVFFNFLSGPLSLLYMQVPSSKHIERTLLVGCWLRLQHLGGYLLAGLNFPVGEGRTSSLEGDLGSLVLVNLDQWADWQWEATVHYCLSLTRHPDWFIIKLLSVVL